MSKSRRFQRLAMLAHRRAPRPTMAMRAEMWLAKMGRPSLLEEGPSK